MGENFTNVSQMFLKSKLPEISGLQLTLLQAKSQTKSKQLQMIQCGERDHWVTATTVGCEVDVVRIYNSLPNLFSFKDQLFKIRVLHPQKQSHCGGTDCGM